MTTPSDASEPLSTHILVVDDDTRLRQLLNRFLMENGYRVTTAKNADDARKYLVGLKFDVIILDVMMPGQNGYDFAASLRETSNVPILMLTARGEAADRITGLERGVDDYLAKPFEPRELLLRIATILRRVQQPAAEPAGEIKLGSCRFNVERGELWRGERPVRLTSSEIALLRALAAKPGKPVSRHDLAQLGGSGMERSIDVQITRLRRKLELDPKTPLYLQTVRGIGYMLVPD